MYQKRATKTHAIFNSNNNQEKKREDKKRGYGTVKVDGQETKRDEKKQQRTLSHVESFHGDMDRVGEDLYENYKGTRLLQDPRLDVEAIRLEAKHGIRTDRGELYLQREKDQKLR